MKKKTILKLLSCCLAGILLIETPMQVGATSAEGNVLLKEGDELEVFIEEQSNEAVEDDSEEATDSLEDESAENRDDTENTVELTEEESENSSIELSITNSLTPDDQETVDESASEKVVGDVLAEELVEDNLATDSEVGIESHSVIVPEEEPKAEGLLENMVETDELFSAEESVLLTSYLTLSAPQYGSIPQYSEDFVPDMQSDFLDSLSEDLKESNSVDISNYSVSPEQLEDALNWLANNMDVYYTLLPHVEYTYIENEEKDIVQEVTVSKIKEDAMLLLNSIRDKDGIKLSFSPIEGVEEYRLFRVMPDEVTEITLDMNTCSAVDPISLDDQTVYKYILCGYRNVEEQMKECTFSTCIVSEYQSVIMDSLFLSIPVPELTYTSENNIITLHWLPVDDVTGYMLYQYENGVYSAVWKEARPNVAGSTEYTYEVTDMKFGETRQYAISAYMNIDGSENKEGDKSQLLDVSLGFDSTELSISSVSYKQVEMAWTQVIQADGYEIQRREKAQDEYEILTTITSRDKLLYTDSSVELNKTYYYRIRPYKKDSDGTIYGGFSSIVSAAPALRAAKIISITSSDSLALKIAWQKVDGAEGYKLERSTSKNGSYSVIQTINSGNILNYQNLSVVPGMTYYYRIRPYCVVNGKNIYGEYSAAVGKTAVLGKVMGVKVTSAAYNTVNINWGKVTGASGYVVERSETSSSDFKPIKTITSGSTLTHRNSSLTVNTKYYYRIRAYYIQADGTKTYGSYSSVVSGTPKLQTSKISSISSVNFNTVKITWTKVTGATGYKLYRSTSSDGTYSAVATIKSGSTISYQNTNLTADKTYYYKVRPYRTEDGKDYYGDYSSAVKGTPKMGGVTGAKAVSASYNSIKVTWSKVAGASGYVVYYSNSQDSGYKILKTTTSTSYVHTGLTSGKLYYYKVRAYRTVGSKKVYGAYSSVISAKPVPATVSAKTSSITYNSIKFTWTKISGANGYEIYRSGSKSGTYTKINTITDVNTVSYTNGGLSTGKTYYYKVRAYRTVNGKKVYGAYSAVVSGTPKLKTTALKKESQTYNSLKLSWKKIDGASGYEIYRSTSKSGTYKNVKTITSGSTLSWTNSGLTTGKTYYYKVRPYRTINGNKVYGEFSELVSVKPVLSKVTSFKATPTGSSSIKLTWKKVTGATGYVIERSTSKEGTYSKLKTITSGTAESYTNNVSAYGQTYYYKIYAVRDDYNGTKVGPVSAMASIMNLSDTTVTVKVGSTVKIAAAVVPSATISWSSSNSKIAKVDSNGKITGVGPGTTTIYAKANGLTKSVKVTVKGQYKGIDVSSYQGTINWKKVADDGIDFAMIRVITGSSSSTTRDTMFKENYDGAKDNGIKVGLYRYSYAISRTKAREEAQNIIDTLHGRKLDYPIVMDMEDSSILSGTNSNARRSEIVLAFKEVIEDAGYDFALYANTTWLNNYLDMNMLKDVDLWVARWRSVDLGHGYSGKGNVVMWQYSSSGSVSGINGKVDMNLSYKSY